MEEKMNIYLKALEIGYILGDEGISFKELKEKLESLKYEFDEHLFRNWFYRSFEHKTRIEFSQQPLRGIAQNEDDNKFRLCSDSLFQYLEYVELKEARENSVIARRESKIAIFLAVLSLVASLATLVISSFYPLEVSDNKVQNQLEELNKTLHENQIQGSHLDEEKNQDSTQLLKLEKKQVEPQTSKKENKR